MRNLTVKQKNILKKWFKERKISKWEDLTLEQMEELEQINDTEVLNQNVDGFLQDLYFK